ncbi:SnoaL-like domain-containing protein [Nocardia uniformis]|uniref:SnoaL-like domain-containing protein n=1 Tax=Nocardia uniformis TaxID=53432 RepID=A0A849C150_9NOCA|nr:nuclear transport factor 2 family protein [Nocardia uniformis]NNH72452.1 SnoaL-like domain-containing protein [Nocardia uniformis]
MSNRDVVEKFYRATQSGDGTALLMTLHPDFEGHVAPGLPAVTGTVFHGPQAALAGIWMPVAQAFDIAPHAEEWFESPGDVVIVTGRYRGTERSTNRPVEAEFAHIWRITEGKLAHLHQFTDTWCWRTEQASGLSGSASTATR